MGKAKPRVQQSYLCGLWRVNPRGMTNYAEVNTLDSVLSSGNVGSSSLSALVSQLDCQQAGAKHSISAGPHYGQ